MTDRITTKDLEALCDRLNKLTRSPLTPCTRTADSFKANIGNYHLSHAYGGVSLNRMSNEAGGVTTPLLTGHTTKRELYNQLHAYIRGIEAGWEQATTT